MSGSDIVARMASAQRAAARGPPAGPTKVDGHSPERRRQLVEVLNVEVRRGDAAEQQLDLLAVVQRGRRHDAALEPELEARRIGAGVGLAPDVLELEASRSRTSRPSSGEVMNVSSSSASMPVANEPPMSPPMLVPAERSIGMRCSSNQRMTPTCAIPRALPPPNATPTVGRPAVLLPGGAPVLPAVSGATLDGRFCGAAHAAQTMTMDATATASSPW